MKVKICNTCKSKIPIQYKKCIHCGAKYKRPIPKILWYGLGLLLISLLFLPTTLDIIKRYRDGTTTSISSNKRDKATPKECVAFKKGYKKYIRRFNHTKQWSSLLLAKEYYDDIILQCDGVVDITVYTNKRKALRKLWFKYVPIEYQKINKWIE